MLLKTQSKIWHVALTGASSGIGMALARLFSEKGHRLSLIARRKNILEKLKNDLPSPVSIYPVDLSDLKIATSWIDEAEEKNGPFDILINNAGIQYVSPTIDVLYEDAEKLLNIDLLAPIKLIHAVLPKMLEKKTGYIINIASMCSINPIPGMFHYNAAKAGLAAASESLRAELTQSGVKIITVYPGPVKTPLEKSAREKLQKSFFVERMPTGTAERLAEIIYKAVLKYQPRVFYPSFYNNSRHFLSLSQWVTEKLTPGLSNEK